MSERDDVSERPPASSAAADAHGAIITDEAAKLPPPWPSILGDAAAALPAGVAFFEKRVVLADLVTAFVGGCVAALLGVIVFPIGVYSLWADRGQRGDSSTNWWVIGFGFTLLVASWMCFTSIVTRWRAMRRQSRGEPTHLGVFVAPDALLEATDNGYCLIPRDAFVGLADRTLSYKFKGETKSTRLPKRLVRDDPRAITAAIERWAGKS